MRNAGGRHTRSLIQSFPGVALLLLAGPVLAGLAGALLPAFGYFPALGGESLSLEHWRLLFGGPGVWKSLLLTLWIGFAATLISLAIVVAIFARFHGSLVLAAMRRMLSPLLAVPHVAVAIGLAFALAPSGLIFRLLSSFVVELLHPPDILIIHDSFGLALIAGLVLKEVPFLFLMTLAALPQTSERRSLAVATTLGYAPATAWLKTVLPRLLSPASPAGAGGAGLLGLSRRCGDCSRTHDAADPSGTGAEMDERSCARDALPGKRCRDPGPRCNDCGCAGVDRRRTGGRPPGSGADRARRAPRRSGHCGCSGEPVGCAHRHPGAAYGGEPRAVGVRGKLEVP